MNKITVTKVQMEAIEGCRDNKESLNGTLSFARGKAFGGSCVCINDMTVEQIVLAWHGYVEVEQELVSLEEAYKARKEGKRVLFIIGNRRVIFMTNVKLEGCFLGSLTMDELFNGKFIVEGDNQ